MSKVQHESKGFSQDVLYLLIVR